MARRALFALLATAAACSAMVSSELEGLPSESEQQATQGAGGDGAGSDGGDPTTTGTGGSGGEPVVGVLPCGAEMCPEDEACCVSGMTIEECAVSCSPDETEVRCLDSADCDAGEICCAYFDPLANKYNSIDCVSDCQTGLEGVARHMCSQSMTCPQGSCQQSQFLPTGYLVCN